MDLLRRRTERFGGRGALASVLPASPAPTRLPQPLARACRSAWLTGVLGLGADDRLAASWSRAAPGVEVGMARRSSCRACSRPCPAVSPTLSSARLSTRCRWSRGKLSRSSVSTATLTFFRVGTSSVVTSSSSSVSSNACRTYSSKAGGGVDDDEVEVLLEQAQDPADQRRRDRVLRRPAATGATSALRLVVVRR